MKPWRSASLRVSNKWPTRPMLMFRQPVTSAYLAALFSTGLSSKCGLDQSSRIWMKDKENE